MIFITGDCHGDFRRFSTECFPEQRNMTKDDYVIICGDFGGVWEESKEQMYWLKWLDSKSFTTLWVDGNHENYDLLDEYMVKQWNGGKVHYIMPSVIHLMRGQVFTIDNHTFFTFGGASSHDIDAGIFKRDDPEFSRKCNRAMLNGISFRVDHLNWWVRELPSEDEMKEARDNLQRADGKVDYIITHCAPTSVQERIGQDRFKNDILTDFFEEISEELCYGSWIFGHYHDNLKIDDKFVVLFEQIVRLI